MPAFITLPPGISPRSMLTEGLPGYSAGSYAIGISPTLMFVTTVAVATNVVTLGVQMQSGNIPATGQLITVQGTVKGGTAVNVTRKALTGVTIAASTGAGTVTYAATTADVATIADGGQAYVEVPEVGEALTVAKFMQFALPQPSGPANTTGHVVTWSWNTPSAPATIALQLEGAVDDIEAQYAIIGTSQTTTSGTIIGNVPLTMRFVRVNITATTGGTNPTIWAKVLV